MCVECVAEEWIASTMLQMTDSAVVIFMLEKKRMVRLSSVTVNIHFPRYDLTKGTCCYMGKRHV